MHLRITPISSALRIHTKERRAKQSQPWLLREGTPCWIIILATSQGVTVKACVLVDRPAKHQAEPGDLLGAVTGKTIHLERSSTGPDYASPCGAEKTGQDSILINHYHLTILPPVILLLQVLQKEALLSYRGLTQGRCSQFCSAMGQTQKPHHACLPPTT